MVADSAKNRVRDREMEEMGCYTFPSPLSTYYANQTREIQSRLSKSAPMLILRVGTSPSESIQVVHVG